MSQPNPFDQPPPSSYPSSGYEPANPNQTPLMLAIGSLVAAVVGLISCGCCLFLPLPIVSLVLGAIALNSKPDQNARLMAIIGMSIAGLTLVAFIVIMILQVVMGMSGPRFPQQGAFEGL